MEIEESEGRNTEDAVQCTFVVTNVGSLTLDACIDNASRGVRFLRSGDIVGFQDAFVDHLECSERFSLGPGQEYRLVTEIDVPNQAVGADEITAWMSVVDPINCGFGGCRSARLEADPVPLRRSPP